MWDTIKAALTNFFNNIKNYLLGAVTFIAAILAGLFYIEKKKNEVLEAKENDQKTQNQIQTINNEIQQVQQTTKEKENEQTSKDDLLKFLNDPNNNK